MQSAAIASCLSLSLSLLSARSAAARERGPLPDAALSAATRRTVVDSLAGRLERKYVVPEVGLEAARALRRHAARGDYDRIARARDFADTLTDHLYAVAHDLHLRVEYDPEGRTTMACGGGGGGVGAADLERVRTVLRQHNYGFERVQRLPGNVGYLELLGFDPPGLGAGGAAAAAMGFLGGCDALIIDLRRNGGGTAGMVEFLMTYLLHPGQRAHLFDMRSRTPEGVVLTQSWTLPDVPGPRFAGKEVFVLTSPLTLSAAESFAYAAQAGKLATIVGERTAGGGNAGSGFVELADGFSAFVASGSVTSPATRSGWEGVGVTPDVAVEAGLALREAHVRAVKSLLAKAEGESDRFRLREALARAEETPPDPVRPPQGMRIVVR